MQQFNNNRFFFFCPNVTCENGYVNFQKFLFCKEKSGQVGNLAFFLAGNLYGITFFFVIKQLY